jgi:polysaccharide biosynthesis protein PslG
MKTWLARSFLGLLLVVAGVGLSRSSTVDEVELGLQQLVRTVNPKMGVHTRLTDEVEPWKIKHTLQLVREMGAPWIVEYFPWAYHEPLPGLYDWSHADLVIDHANRQGLTVIARLGFVPEWARPGETASSFLAPERYQDFGDYVYAFVKRYRGKVDYVVIWNEPNLALEWGFQPIDPEGYTALLAVAYRRAREANPGVQVLGGALAPTLAPPGSEWGLNDLVYLQRMYEAGAAEVMDGLAVHAYGWVYPADDPPDPEVVNFRRVELVRQIMEANGHGAAHIFITEGGWNDHPRWTRAVRPGQRIEYTLQAYEMSRHWPWLDVLAVWAFRYPWPARTYLDYYTFVSSDFQPKPIYLEVQRYARGE